MGSLQTRFRMHPHGLVFVYVGSPPPHLPTPPPPPCSVRNRLEVVKALSAMDSAAMQRRLPLGERGYIALMSYLMKSEVLTPEMTRVLAGPLPAGGGTPYWDVKCGPKPGKSALQYASEKFSKAPKMAGFLTVDARYVATSLS